jgi:Flp pilus assembly protein TadG
VSINFRKLTRSRKRGERGAVAIIFALCLIPLILAVGIGIDVVRAMYARSLLQAGVDTAVLAVAADRTLSQTQINKLVNDYIKINGKTARLNDLKLTAPVLDTTAQTVSFGAQAKIPTYFVRVIKITEMAIGVSAKAKIGEAGPSVIVLAVDITTSMSLPLAGGGTRMSVTKDAATALVNQMMRPPNQGARVGLITFGTFVSLGGPTSSIMTNFSAPGDPVTNYITPAAPFTSCSRPPSCYVPCPLDGVPDAGRCLIPNCPHPWVCSPPTGGGGLGCASYRPPGFRDTVAFVPGQNRHMAVTALCWGSASFPNDNLVQVNDDLKKNLVVRNSTTWIPSGLLWAWHSLTPEAPILAPPTTKVEDLGGKRVLILLTDGESTARPNVNNDGFFAPWPTTAAGAENPNTVLESLCDNITSNKIDLYTVFINDNTPASQSFRTVMKQCANDHSMAFDVGNRTELLQAFERIGNRVQKVRLVE